MKKRFSIIPAVFVIVRNQNGHILLHKRARTGFMDGYYDLPSGHVEAGETLRQATAREAKEEVDVMVKVSDLALVHIGQNHQERPYINFMFEARLWTGKPRICEPEKCDDLGFFPVESLPKTVPHVAEVLRTMQNGIVSFLYFEPGYTIREDI